MQDSDDTDEVEVEVGSGWQPTGRQVRLAEALGSGYTMARACELAEISYSSGRRWYSNPGKPEFIALVDEVRRQVKRAYAERFGDVMNLALELEQRVLTGEVSPDDHKAKIAHDILSKTAYRSAGLGGGIRRDESRRGQSRTPRAWPVSGS